MATIARDSGCSYVHVGGIDDHVHMLLLLDRKKAPMDIIAKIKKQSSKFIKTLGDEYDLFHWQTGYGMFSVSPTHINDVEAYIDGQEHHHRKLSFKDEFLAFLHKYNIEYDERYIWD